MSSTHWLFLKFVLAGIFQLALPLAAHLPPAIGRRVAARIGRSCARHDVDWRTLALRRHYVSEDTATAFTEIEPRLDDLSIRDKVTHRFVNALLEELEGHWLACGRTAVFQCGHDDLPAIRSAMGHRRGIVLLTFHFDAALMGVAQLGLAGLKLNLMTSDVVEDRRVLPAVQRYFAAKYSGIEACLNGGKTLHVEHHLKDFYQALRAGEGVVILGDAPGDPSRGAVMVDFLGKKRAFAPGAVRLAEKTRAPLAAFVCLRQKDGTYRTVFSPVYWPNDNRHQDNIGSLYAFLESWVRQYPERWWAADQLPKFICADADRTAASP